LRYLALVRLFQRHGSVTMWESWTIGTTHTRIGIVVRVVRAWLSEEMCRRRQEVGEANTKKAPVRRPHGSILSPRGFADE
jgi:hypothetical protein